MTGVVEVVVAGVSAISAAAAPVTAAVSAASPWITGGLALASAGLQISGARQQAVTSQVQATQAGVSAQQQELVARQEELRGQQQANQVRENMLRTLAAQNARYAAAGAVLGDGSPETVADDTRREAELQLAIGGSNATARAAAARSGAASQRIQASLLADRGEGAQTAAVFSAGASLFDLVDRGAQRQPGRRTAPGAAL